MQNVQRTSAAVAAERHPTMMAVEHDRYGAPDALECRDVEVPELDDDRVLVRVHAAATNPLDLHFLSGTPWLLRLVAGLRRPKNGRRGVDASGVIEAVGRSVTRFRVGDEVFGGGPGSFAEFVACKEDGIAIKPVGMSYAEAAAIPVAAVTALQGLRDHASLQPGQSVLINGAGGGVGPYAVQIAKHLGADVTAVCGAHNVDMVRSLGADRVVDYSTEDVVELGRRFDAILDNVGNRSLADCRRMLSETGVLVMVSGPKHNRLLGPIGRVIRAKIRFLIGQQRAVTFTADETHAELSALATMVDEGRLRSVIDRTYPLAETANALRYLAEGHARGKVVISVVADEAT